VKNMTEQERAGKISALIHELAGYERRGKTERAAAVRAELARLGAEGATPSARAAKRAKR